MAANAPPGLNGGAHMLEGREARDRVPVAAVSVDRSVPRSPRVIRSFHPIVRLALLPIALGTIWLSLGSVYLPHVDDLYIIAWAKTVADGAALPVHALSRFYPEPDYFLNAPRLHIYSLAAWIKAFGWSLDSLLAFRATLFAATSAVIVAVAVRRDLPLLAVFFPVALLVAMLHTGQRPESTALLLFTVGLAILWADSEPGRPISAAIRTLAKIALVLAPLAWPSALAYSAGLLIASDLRDFSRRPLRQLVAEDLIVLTIGVLALGVMVGFDYAEFLRVYLGVTKEHDDILSFNRMRFFNGSLLLIGAYLVRRQAGDVAFVVAAIGVGMLLGLILHTKLAISFPLVWLALLAMLDAASRDMRWRQAAWAVAAATFVVFLANQSVFALAARNSPTAAAAVQQFADTARREGRTLLTDEIGATFGLGLQIDGVYSWSFGLLHPAGRVKSVDQIREGESWIISSYTVHGWLKSTGVDGMPARRPEIDGLLPGTPCLTGRNSCRLPALRWAYYLIERRGGVVSIRMTP